MTKKISDLDTKNLQSQQKPQIDLLAGYNLNSVANGAGFGVLSNGIMLDAGGNVEIYNNIFKNGNALPKS